MIEKIYHEKGDKKEDAVSIYQLMPFSYTKTEFARVSPKMGIWTISRVSSMVAAYVISTTANLDTEIGQLLPDTSVAVCSSRDEPSPLRVQ